MDYIFRKEEINKYRIGLIVRLDKDNQPVSQHLYNANGGIGIFTKFGSNGKVSSEIRYIYDVNGRLIEMNSKKNDSLSGKLSSTKTIYHYDPNGKLERKEIKTSPAKTEVVLMEYNPEGLLVRENWGEFLVLQDILYRYTEQNILAEIERKTILSSNLYRRENEEYDIQGRLVAFHASVANSAKLLQGSESHILTYNDEGLLIAITSKLRNSLGGKLLESESQYEIGPDNLPVQGTFKSKGATGTFGSFETNDTFLYNQEALKHQHL